VEELSQLVSDETVLFFALSHRELWESWEDDEQPAWLIEHARVLRERYDVSLS